jgi:hypothetical protein
MAQRNTTQIVSNEADVQLAISSINSRQFKAARTAAAIYIVAETTLRRRRAGKSARRDCQPNSKKLTQVEEEVIVKYILDLDLRILRTILMQMSLLQRSPRTSTIILITRRKKQHFIIFSTTYSV